MHTGHWVRLPSRHPLAHWMVFAGHGAQTPFWQNVPSGQTIPHAPQFSSSVWMNAQNPPQSVKV